MFSVSSESRKAKQNRKNNPHVVLPGEPAAVTPIRAESDSPSVTWKPLEGRKISLLCPITQSPGCHLLVSWWRGCWWRRWIQAPCEERKAETSQRRHLHSLHNCKNWKRPCWGGNLVCAPLAWTRGTCSVKIGVSPPGLTADRRSHGLWVSGLGTVAHPPPMCGPVPAAEVELCWVIQTVVQD